jgi:FlaA1/EpsC-like NDP-sugar epimerase
VTFGDLDSRIAAARDRLAAWLVTLGRYQKRTIVVAADSLVLSCALVLSFYLRYGWGYLPPDWRFTLLVMAVPVLGVLAFAQVGLYRLVTRYIGGRAVNRIAGALGLSIMVWALLIFMTGLQGTPRTTMLLYWMLGTTGTLLVRQIAARILLRTGAPLAVPDRGSVHVLIWGAGPLGLQLADALERSGRYQSFGFIDSDSNLWGQYVGGQKVYRPERIPGLIERHAISEVLLAIPGASRQERAEVLHHLEPHPVAVRTLPQLEDIASGKVKVSSLRAVEAEDLLGRDAVPPDQVLLSRCVAGKNVMVTGAGGSIGSELVRQIVRQTPRTLVLFEASENALYEIESEVRLALAALPADAVLPSVVAVLGSVLDPELVARTIEAHAIQTIYHAAAFKHVPIVEANAVVGFRNNTFGTLTVAEAAERAGVERFVLISTDKAVRPSSLMGASKRLAEMVLQARADEPGQGTIFTMVRFGNVLDSSGSVVRLFRKQIARGGPVTVTHPGMIRYFMSIPEAATLVIQAGAMASGGEVFVLDMGEPVKIDDLARSMVRLMGREIKDVNNPAGDIEISYVGLRPGEKLREELLLGENTAGTEHPRIQRSMEPYLPLETLEGVLDQLRTALVGGEPMVLQALLQRVVEGYHVGGVAPEEEVVPPPSDWHPGTSTLH